MESVKLTLSMNDLSRVLNALVTRPYAEVADLIENLKTQVQWNAAEIAKAKVGAQQGDQDPGTPAPNGAAQGQTVQ